MKIGIAGLGRMGGNMASLFLKNKMQLVVWNKTPEAIEEKVLEGAIAAYNFADIFTELKTEEKKIIWLMLPSGAITEEYFQKSLNLLNAGDIIIEGANSQYQDSLRRHQLAQERGIEMLDVGVSGGIIAASTGYPMMIGGKLETYQYCLPIFKAIGLADGFNLVGGPGAGHYVKMIHNAIEYGMMQAIAEGFDLLDHGHFKGQLDLPKISHIWNHGTIVSSFLMKMVESALNKDPKLNYLKPYVEDNGEGRWSAIEALNHNVPFVVNSYALNARYISREENSLAFRMLAAMRQEFGGHAIKK